MVPLPHMESSHMQSVFRFDIAHDNLPSDIADGDDVTREFSSSPWAPTRAVVIKRHGPAGGNPLVEFTWAVDAHGILARAWAIENGIIEGDDPSSAGADWTMEVHRVRV